jgi:hypothetical protein
MELISYMAIFAVIAFFTYIGYNKNSRILCTFGAIMLLLLHVNVLSLSSTATGGLGYITGYNQTTVGNLTSTVYEYNNVFFGGSLGTQSYAILLIIVSMYILFAIHMPEGKGINI